MSTISPSWRWNCGSIMQILQNWIAHLEHARQKTISKLLKLKVQLLNGKSHYCLTVRGILQLRVFVGVRSFPLIRSIGKNPSVSRRDVHRCPPNTLRKFPLVVHEISGNVQNGWMRRYGSLWDLAFISILSNCSKMHLYDIWQKLFHILVLPDMYLYEVLNTLSYTNYFLFSCVAQR
jgi:hypothetical protein